MKERNSAHTKKKWAVGGVYAAMGVCLIAVAAAAWTTFQSISSTLQNHTQDTTQNQLIEPANETVSGVTEGEVQSAVEEASATEEEAAASAVNATPTSLQLPLENGISKSFSGEELVYSLTLKDWRTHNGTDFQAEAGEAVLAIADGKVIKVYDDGLLGNVVVVASGDMEAYYCGLDSEIPVGEGETVTAGQTIGVVGEIPAEQAETPHLHLEIKENGVYLDCETLMETNS